VSNDEVDEDIDEVVVNDEEITPIEAMEDCTHVDAAIEVAKARGEKYFFWHGNVVTIKDWRNEICRVKWKKSEFDSRKEVSLAYWKDGFRYVGNIERLRNLAGRTHY
jgi:hypothetical protein